jgi:CHASE3 domain sensor protein
MKIKTQLFVGFAIILLLVIILCFAAYFQGRQLYIQTETITEHPMQTKSAVCNLKIDILKAGETVDNLLISNDDNNINKYADMIEASDTDAEKTV